MLALARHAASLAQALSNATLHACSRAWRIRALRARNDGITSNAVASADSRAHSSGVRILSRGRATPLCCAVSTGRREGGDGKRQATGEHDYGSAVVECCITNATRHVAAWARTRMFGTWALFGRASERTHRLPHPCDLTSCPHFDHFACLPVRSCSRGAL